LLGGAHYKLASSLVYSSSGVGGCGGSNGAGGYNRWGIEYGQKKNRKGHM